MYPNIIKKIPGDVILPSRKESQGYISDLGKEEKFQLQELLERQDKILNNRNFISKLPDKGEKIRNFRNKIVKELEHRNEVQKAADLLSQLNIASKGQKIINKLEWTGEYDENGDETKIVELDSDDDEEPLKILAQPTGTGVHNKKIIHLAPEESLIKPEDLVEIESVKTDSDIDYVKCIIDKVEKLQESTKEPFKPYKTTKSNVHDPNKEKQRKLPKNWEVTAATPPLIVHGAAKILNLEESLILQKQLSAKLQEIQAKHALNRLTNQIGLYSVDSVPKDENYQLHSTNDSSEEYEVYDDEDDDKDRTVKFTLDSEEN